MSGNVGQRNVRRIVFRCTRRHSTLGPSHTGNTRLRMIERTIFLGSTRNRRAIHNNKRVAPRPQQRASSDRSSYRSRWIAGSLDPLDPSRLRREIADMLSPARRGGTRRPGRGAGGGGGRGERSRVREFQVSRFVPSAIVSRRSRSARAWRNRNSKMLTPHARVLIIFAMHNALNERPQAGGTQLRADFLQQCPEKFASAYRRYRSPIC
jgi:hypothetical protein